MEEKANSKVSMRLIGKNLEDLSKQKGMLLGKLFCWLELSQNTNIESEEFSMGANVMFLYVSLVKVRRNILDGGIAFELRKAESYDNN